MSAHRRDETSVVRHRTPGCLVCGAELRRAGTGRRRRYCGGACRQRGAGMPEADPAEVNRLLAAVLRASTRR